MTAKEYLSQLYEISKTKAALQRRIDDLTVRAGYGQGKSYAKAFGGDNERRCPMEECILSAWEKTDELEELLAQTDELQAEITKAINAVEDERCRTILIMRYIEFMSFPNIAHKLGYSEIRTLFKHHGNALMMVRVPKTQYIVD